MKLRALLAAAASLAVFTTAATASAQSIDYGSLEILFGEPVTTSATGSPQRASEAPVAMDIITAEDIKRSGAVDIPTILGRVAGVNVLTWGSGNADVSVRGYDQAMSPRLLVLINGRQVYTDSYGYTDWNALPVQLSEIRQIEVVKGPNSALFGFNAVGGVINIVTYNPKYDQVASASATVGTQRYNGYDLVQTLKLGDLVGLRISLGDNKADEFKNTNPLIPQGELHPPHTVDAAVDLLAQITPKLQARVEASWVNSQQDMSLIQNFYSRSRTLNNSERLTLIDDSPIGLLQVSAYKNANTTSFAQPPEQYDWDNYVTVLQAQDLLKLDSRNTIRVSFEYRHNSLDSTPDDVGRVVYDVYSPSIMWNAIITKKLSTTLAVRYDSLKLGFTGVFPAIFPISAADYDRTLGTVSANAGVVYQADDKDTLRLAYARGIQVPSLADLGGVLEAVPEPFFPHGALTVIGNPRMLPAIVSNYEADWDRGLPKLGAKIALRVFYQTTDHLPSLPPENGTLSIYPGPVTAAAIQFENAGDSNMVGGEIGASGKFGRGYHWNANYLYSDVHDLPLPGVSLVAQESAFAATTPKHTGNLGLGWADAKWSLDGFVQMVSSHEGYQFGTGALTPVGGYATLAGRVAYRLSKQITFAVSGQNLQSSSTIETPGLPVERRLFATLSASW
jgi:iron complex outermembrane receptor protein